MKNLFDNYNIKKENNLFCPSCGEKCDITLDRCRVCSYDFIEYKNIIFSKYNYFNRGYNLLLNNNYFEALLELTKYMAFDNKDEDAYKLYIYSLVKNNKIDLAKEELIKFEKKFPISSLIMDIELVGLENIEMPKVELKNISIDEISNPIDKLNNEYCQYRLENTNEIINLTIDFFDILRIARQKKYKEIIDFYEKRFLKFLSKKEIRIEIFDGKKMDELTDEQIQTINVIDKKKSNKKNNNVIKTIYPAIYLRSKLIKRQDIIVFTKDL